MLQTIYTLIKVHFQDRIGTMDMKVALLMEDVGDARKMGDRPFSFLVKSGDVRKHSHENRNRETNKRERHNGTTPGIFAKPR